METWIDTLLGKCQKFYEALVRLIKDQVVDLVDMVEASNINDGFQWKWINTLWKVTKLRGN